MTISSVEIAAQIQETAPQIVADCLTRSNGMLNFLQQNGRIITDITNADGPMWQMAVTDATGGTEFTAGDPAPATTSMGFVEAKLDWRQFHTTVRLLGLDRDKLGKADTKVDNLIARITETQIGQMLDDVESKLLTDWVAFALDTGTYATVDRALFPAAGSYTNTAGAPRAISDAILATTHDAFIDTNKGMYSKIITTSAQRRAIAALPGAHAIQSVLQNGAPGAAVQLGYSTVTYEDREVIAIPGFTSGCVYFIDPMQMALEVLKDITVEPLAKVNDDENWYITYKCRLVLYNPRKGAAAILQLS